MPDDDRSQDSDASRPSTGFSAFGADQKREEQRKRRRGLIGRSVAAVLVLCAVGAVAAVTTKGSTPGAHPSTGTGVPKIGTVLQPVPPQVVFVTDKVGYAIFTTCVSQPNGEGCRPSLWRTTDGGAKGAASWTALTLAPDMPVDPHHWLEMQADDQHVLLSWTDGSWLSGDRGDHWAAVVAKVGSRSDVPAGQFLVGDANPMFVVNPDNGTALAFRMPKGVEAAGATGGTLSDNNIWVRDVLAVGVSSDRGTSWNVAPIPTKNSEGPVLAGKQGYLALLTGFDQDATVGGQPGDGADVPATSVYFSTNEGSDWGPATLLTAPAVNALCTVYLDDQTLLGVSSDRRSLLSMPKGGGSFAVTSRPGLTATPSCLQSHNALVWGALASSIALSTDGAKTWSMLALPSAAHAVAAPSPTASPTS